MKEMLTTIDLQHFAAIEGSQNTFASSVPTYLNTNTTNSEGMQVENKTFYYRTLLKMAGPNLVHDEDAEKKPIPKNGGKTVEFRKRVALKKALAPLVEGVTPNGNTLAFESQTVDLHQHGDYVVLSDLLEDTAIDGIRAEAVEAIGDQMGRTKDTLVRNAMHQTTNVKWVDKVVSNVHTAINHRYDLDENCTLTVQEIRKAVTMLKAKNTPRFGDGMYHAVINPFVSYDLQRDPEFIDISKYAQADNLLKGEIGKLGGVRFKESTEAKVFYGADLASDSRTLLVDGNGSAISSGTTIDFDGGTVAAHALKGRTILVGGTQFTVEDNTTSAITVKETITSSIADNTVIYPGEGGKGGLPVFGTLIYGKGAYATTEVDGIRTEVIIHERGSGGTSDAINQRESVGWKTFTGSAVLVPEYIMRVESVSPDYSSLITEEN